MWEGSEWKWNLRWRRARFEWESVMEMDLAVYISRITMKKEEQDSRVWGNIKQGCFSVKSAYATLAKRGSGRTVEVS